MSAPVARLAGGRRVSTPGDAAGIDLESDVRISIRPMPARYFVLPGGANYFTYAGEFELGTSVGMHNLSYRLTYLLSWVVLQNSRDQGREHLDQRRRIAIMGAVRRRRADVNSMQVGEFLRDGAEWCHGYLKSPGLLVQYGVLKGLASSK